MSARGLKCAPATARTRVVYERPPRHAVKLQPRVDVSRSLAAQTLEWLPRDWQAQLRVAFWRDPAEALRLVYDLNGEHTDWTAREWRAWGHELYGVDGDAPVDPDFVDELDPLEQWREPQRLLERLVLAHPHRARTILAFVDSLDDHVERSTWRYLIARGRRAQRVTHSSILVRCRAPRARARERRSCAARSTRSSSASSDDGGSSEPHLVVVAIGGVR